MSQYDQGFETTTIQTLSFFIISMDAYVYNLFVSTKDVACITTQYELYLQLQSQSLQGIILEGIVKRKSL